MQTFSVLDEHHSAVSVMDSTPDASVSSTTTMDLTTTIPRRPVTISREVVPAYLKDTNKYTHYTLEDVSDDTLTDAQNLLAAEMFLGLSLSDSGESNADNKGAYHATSRVSLPPPGYSVGQARMCAPAMTGTSVAFKKKARRKIANRKIPPVPAFDDDPEAEEAENAGVEGKYTDDSKSVPADRLEAPGVRHGTESGKRSTVPLSHLMDDEDGV